MGLEDELEEIFDINDMLSENLQDEKIGPDIIKC